MRGSALAVVLGILGCATVPPAASTATAPPATAKAKPPPPKADVKREVIVMGRGAPTAPPGEVSIAPKDQGSEFGAVGRSGAIRCTKTDSKDPDDRIYCRNLGSGDSRNPDPGRLERSKTQAGWH